jgi:hypothetical protein
MILFSVIHGSKRLSKSFSRVLAKNGSRLMGRKEEIESGGLLGLGTKIIVENFHKIGKQSKRKTELKIWERWTIAFFR